MSVFKRPSNRSTTPTNRNITIAEEPEPTTPSGNDIVLYNDGDVIRAKFSDGSTVTIGQQ